MLLVRCKVVEKGSAQCRDPRGPSAPRPLDPVWTESQGAGRQGTLTSLKPFAGLTALLLAVVGIYGVASYSVQQRTREMGIRLALGAQPLSLISLMMRHGGWTRSPPFSWRWCWRRWP